MIPLRDDNPSRSAPVVTVVLLAANILVFLYEMSLGPEIEELVFKMGLIPAEVTSAVRFEPHLPLPLTFLTSMFLHGDLMHLAGNMLYLWIFGNNVEDEAGHAGFALFYLVSGLAAAAAQIVAMPGSEVPMIGASGAIAGVLGGYMVLFPHARVLTMIPIFFFIRLVYLPAVLMLGLWFVYQVVLSNMTSSTGGGVAFFAHIGGFVAGAILIFAFRRPRREAARRYRAWARYGDD
ncbi:MAG TPA: rhomboid family intramembrane serine protease [Candidatus Polarisedimenticolia bacterium]|nr:rhomboid family intramembrane serine protease [Candidatus Polarisedimenticolia bacterium]